MHLHETEQVLPSLDSIVRVQLLKAGNHGVNFD